MAKKKQRQSKQKSKPRSRPAAVKEVQKPQGISKGAEHVAPKITFPVTAHVAKGGDNIPVTVTDQAHLDRLIAEHGAPSVQVQQ